MDDGLEHISRKTRERVYVLAKNAKSLAVHLGSVRFTPHYDYMSFYLTNGTDYVIIFCFPSGYLVELWYDEDGTIESTYSSVRNIRHFLQWLKKLGYQDMDVAFDTEGAEDSDTEGEQDLRTFLEEDDG